MGMEGQATPLDDEILGTSKTNTAKDGCKKIKFDLYTWTVRRNLNSDDEDEDKDDNDDGGSTSLADLSVGAEEKTQTSYGDSETYEEVDEVPDAEHVPILSKWLPAGCPSAGKWSHDSGDCKPCFFMNTRAGCKYGTSCLYCHDEDHLRQKQSRPLKQVREECMEHAADLTVALCMNRPSKTALLLAWRDRVRASSPRSRRYMVKIVGELTKDRPQASRALEITERVAAEPLVRGRHHEPPERWEQLRERWEQPAECSETRERREPRKALGPIGRRWSQTPSGYQRVHSYSTPLPYQAPFADPWMAMQMTPTCMPLYGKVTPGASPGPEEEVWMSDPSWARPPGISSR